MGVAPENPENGVGVYFEKFEGELVGAGGREAGETDPAVGVGMLAVFGEGGGWKEIQFGSM